MSAERPLQAAPPIPSIPSIGTRLANALAVWSVVWGMAVGASVWLAASAEVDELLDDALTASASLVATLAQAAPAVAVMPDVGNGGGRFAWQVVGAGGQLTQRSATAPAWVWHATPRPGYSDSGGWRLYGMALGDDGRMLYFAQTRAERREAQREVVISAVLAALAVGLLGQVWLRARARAALQPLQSLSDRVAAWNLEPARADDVLGEVTRRELRPLHDALHTLALRLQTRVANERAFAAHAAHALRTPLAAIDAQLAVALRQSPPELNERLQRVREAATRLQAVVAALLGLFRSGDEPRRSLLTVDELIQRLPVHTLALQAAGDGQGRISADADLLLAALINLLDNAKRHGAQQMTLRALPSGDLQIDDDGEGVPASRRQALQAALDREAYGEPVDAGVGDDSVAAARDAGQGPRMGLGLMLADRVARAHGGRLQLLDSERGFSLLMTLPSNTLYTETE